MDGYQLIGMRIRQRTQQNTIDHREHRRIRPDTEGEREHRDPRKHGISPDRPAGITQMPDNRVDYLRSVHRVNLLLNTEWDSPA